MTEDFIIDALVKIGNHKEVIKILEAHVAFSMKIEAWQVRRILKACELLQQEWDMKFNEVNKVIIETMNESEARAFVKFLKSEMAGHYMDIDNAQELIEKVTVRFKLVDK